MDTNNLLAIQARNHHQEGANAAARFAERNAVSVESCVCERAAEEEVASGRVR